MKRRVLRGMFILALLALCASLSAQDIILTVSDFSVESDNTSYKYLGKGISTLVAGELRRTKTIKILEREQLNRIIEEQKMSLSGLMDESKQLEIGKLLSADYIVFGEIIDMAAAVLISVRMADIETGEVVWEDSMTEKLESYDYIGAYFAQSILAGLDLEAEEATVAKVETKEVKQETAIIALSSGIDAYDRGDEEKAKEELKTVQKIDPGNEVARFYLSKLQALSPKFRVETDLYAPVYNPASLGFLEKGRIYSWLGIHAFAPVNEDWNGDSRGYVLDGYYLARDEQSPFIVGISLPMGSRFGLSLGINFSGDESHVDTRDDAFSTGQRQSNWGAFAGFGARVNKSFGVGVSTMVYYTHPNSDESDDIEGVSVSLSPGVVFQSPDGGLIGDLTISYTTQEINYFDTESSTIVTGNYPVILDASLTYALTAQKLFLGFKGITGIFIDDRGGYSLRLIPMAEFWPWVFLSLRAGYEFSLLDQVENMTMGHGAIGGFSLKIGMFDLNANITYRQKPVRQLPGYTIPDIKFLIGLESHPEFLPGRRSERKTF